MSLILKFDNLRIGAILIRLTNLRMYILSSYRVIFGYKLVVYLSGGSGRSTERGNPLK